jgi:hypothetical protein
MRQAKPVGKAVGRSRVRPAAWFCRLLVWAALAAAAAAQAGPPAITVDRGGQESGEPAAVTIRFPYGCPVLRFPAPPRQEGHDFVLLVEATGARCDERVTQQAFTATLGPLAPGSYTVRAKKLEDESVIASATFELAAAQTTSAPPLRDRVALRLTRAPADLTLSRQSPRRLAQAAADTPPSR